MYQKCPICNGTGIDQVPTHTSGTSTSKCSTCKGKQILDEVTGKPPNQVNRLDAELEFINELKQVCEGCLGWSIKNK